MTGMAALFVLAAGVAFTPAAASPLQFAQATTPGSGTSESLSSKLDRSGGVIKPKSDIDPDIRVGAPDPNPHSTPVIPPAATGGSNAK